MHRAALRAWSMALALTWSWLLAALPAQGQGAPLDPTTVTALETLAGKIAAAEARRAQVAAADTSQLAQVDQELRELRWQLGSLAARVDVQGFEAPHEAEFDLQAELEELIRPLIQSVKDATAEPRQIAGLKERIAALLASQQQAEAAQRQAEATLSRLPEGSAARAAVRHEIDVRWKDTINDLRNERVILEARLLAKEQGRQSVVEGISDAAQKFLQSSGLNLLLAALVFCGVFFGLRWVQGLLLRRRAERRTTVRVLEIVLAALSMLLAIAATLVVPYVRNDWLLLAVCIVFLLGVGWVLVRMLPQFFDQIRLVLNVGPVRENERLMLAGIPYRVETLRFYSRLVNPELQGGVLRVPIGDLLALRSRPSGEGEPWFPCRIGEHVLLDDGVFGRVLMQTPEAVVVDDVAAPKTYRTGDFLDQRPRNLSRGFGVRSAFGIDYRHQREATTAIPAALTAALRAGLEQLVPKEQIRRVQVEFMAAGSSSLDLNARADFTGEAAGTWRELNRAMQRLLVDACTANGWNIPFPQLTVHRAE